MPPGSSLAAAWMAHAAFRDERHGPDAYGKGQAARRAGPRAVPGRPRGRARHAASSSRSSDPCAPAAEGDHHLAPARRARRRAPPVPGARRGRRPGARTRRPRALDRHRLGRGGVRPGPPRGGRAPSIRPGPSRILLDLAGGLAHLHARGVIHRDVSPANVVLSAAGPAVLIDPGQAGSIAGVRPLGPGRRGHAGLPRARGHARGARRASRRPPTCTGSPPSGTPSSRGVPPPSAETSSSPWRRPRDRPRVRATSAWTCRRRWRRRCSRRWRRSPGRAGHGTCIREDARLRRGEPRSGRATVMPPRDPARGARRSTRTSTRSGSTARIDSVRDGDLVEVRTREGRPCGFGFFHSRSLVNVRVLSHDPDVVPDEAWLRERIRAAEAIRRDVLRLRRAHERVAGRARRGRRAVGSRRRPLRQAPPRSRSSASAGPDGSTS